jgi:hypothetical protein
MQRGAFFMPEKYFHTMCEKSVDTPHNEWYSIYRNKEHPTSKGEQSHDETGI